MYSYCRKNYDADKEESSDVYLSLIRMYLHPPDLKEYGVPRPEPNVNAALRVIACHHHHVNTAEVGGVKSVLASETVWIRFPYIGHTYIVHIL